MPGSHNQWSQYRPQVIEPKWRQRWEASGIYRASEGGGRPKFYCLEYFPYPSGEGLHVGHCRNYIPSDVLSRYKRMQGFNVLHPMGWDSFGEPTEHFAITHGVHPRLTTDRNTASFKRQLQLIGASYDWQREIDSSRPEYYRWTQWFFRLLYQHDLAYRDSHYQWWCPVCQTTLSSHEIHGDTCWRGHPGVSRKQIPAWYFRITAYAEELLASLDTIDWPEAIKQAQKNWIGRSPGAEVHFSDGGEIELVVFTTRPETIFGATFIAVSPEHARLAQLTLPQHAPNVSAYIQQALQKSEIERKSDQAGFSGVFTGCCLKNPLTGENLPVWVADYVLPGYGTGAIMGVPAHDGRDWQFAQVHNLPARQVVAEQAGSLPGELAEAFCEAGVMVNTGVYDGIPSQQAAEAVITWLEERFLGKRAVYTKMRDWLISRQRYWGTPIPVIVCERCGDVLVPEEQLPVLLPDLDDFKPDGSGHSPLARNSQFLHTTCPGCGGPATRETDTLGGFACSSWYFLRFTSPDFHDGPFRQEAAGYWMPVDLYVGGAEHAVLHLLYARFWTKFLADCGLVSFREPFSRLMNQGQMMGTDGVRMSKSRGNVITPDHIVERYGADALRVYELFMAPFDQASNWSENGIQGAWRFVNKVWSLYQETYAAYDGSQRVDEKLSLETNRLIRKVTSRIETFRFNTLISTLMEFVNYLAALQRPDEVSSLTYRNTLDTFNLLIAPVMPFIAEEIWQFSGHQGSVHQQPWSQWASDLPEEDLVAIPVQVNGRLRAVIEIERDTGEVEVRAQALSESKVKNLLKNRSIANTHYVANKVINFVLADQADE